MPAAGEGGPEEWGWRVIAALGWTTPAYPGLIPQAFFSLAALLQGAASWFAGGLALLLGQARFMAELILEPRMAGRLAAALLGAGQIPLAYLLGRRVFDSVATGLLAAALVAVSPLLVVQSHYIGLEIPLGLLTLLTALMAWQAMETPRRWLMTGLGFTLGLAAATSVAGILLWPVGLAVWAAAASATRVPRMRRWLFWPLCLLGGIILGLGLGAPSLWWPQEVGPTWEWSSLGLAIPPEGGWLAPGPNPPGPGEPPAAGLGGPGGGRPVAARPAHPAEASRDSPPGGGPDPGPPGPWRPWCGRPPPPRAGWPYGCPRRRSPRCGPWCCSAAVCRCSSGRPPWWGCCWRLSFWPGPGARPG